MRNPRPEDFSTQVFDRKTDSIDLDGVVPLRSKAERSVPKQNRTDESAIMTARQLDGMTASHHDSTPSRLHDSMTAEQISYIFSCLSEKATQKTTVRLPAGLLERLEEVVYEIKKNHHLRLSMNSIFVATLAFFCQEYEKSGKHSSLFEELKKFYDQMPS